MSKALNNARKLNSMWVSVTEPQFGAKGDGSTDDTAAIQAALNTGKDVFFPATTSYYKISSALIPLSDQELFGEGRSSQIRQITSLANAIHATGKTAVSIRSLGVYAVGDYNAYNNGCGVLLQDCTDCEVLRVTVQNARGGGVVLYNTNDSRVERCRFLNSPVADLESNGSTSFDIGVVYSSSRNVITRNVIQSGQATGIQLQSVIDGDANDDNIVTHNIIRDSKAYGIIAYRNDQDGAPYTMTTKRTIIAHNNIKNIRGTILNSAVANYSFGAGVYIQGAEDFDVSNNLIGGTHAANPVVAETLAPGAIGIGNVTRGVVSDNVIYDAGWSGIDITDPLGFGDTVGFLNVADNIITNCVKNGIRTRDRSRVRISGNEVDTTAASGIRQNNASTGVAATDVSIIGNIVRNSTTGTAAIEVNIASGVEVSGNITDTSAVHGISLASAAGANVVGNTVRNHTVRGIQIASTCSAVSLDGNSVVGTGTSSEGYRIDIGTALIGDSNRVSGCVLSWVGAGPDWVGIRNFGATGDGTTNDTAAIQAAITAATGMTPKRRLMVPGGTYLLTAVLTATTGLEMVASDGTAIFKRSAAATARILDIDGKTDVVIQGIEFDLDNVVSGGGQPAITIKATGATNPSNIYIKDCTFRNGSGRPYIDFQSALSGENWNVTGNEFYGNSAGACRYLVSQTGSKTIKFDNNLMDGCGGPVYQMRAAGVADVATQTDWYYDVSICHNTWTDLTGGVNGPIPAEIFSYVNLTCHGNNIDSGTRGLCAQAGKNGSYIGNNISNQTMYWAEMGNCDGVLFVGNTGKDNAAFVTDTSSVGSKNVYFGSNFIKGGGSTYSAVTPSHGITMNSNATGLYENWTIENMVFIDMINVRNIIRIDSDGTFKPKNIKIKDITIRATDEFVPVQVIQVRRGDGVEIDGVRVTRTANLTANTPPTGGVSAHPFVSWTAPDVQDLTIRDVRIVYTGTDTRGGGAKVIGIGANAAANTLPNLRIEDCRIQGDGTNYLNGLLVAINSGDSILRRNETYTTGSVDAINSAVRTPSGYVTQGDADYAFTPTALDVVTIEYTAALTANRAVSLATTAAQITQIVRVVRASTATGAFNINVGTGPLKALAAASTWCEVTYSGGAWRLTANGTL